MTLVEKIKDEVCKEFRVDESVLTAKRHLDNPRKAQASYALLLALLDYGELMEFCDSDRLDALPGFVEHLVATDKEFKDLCWEMKERIESWMNDQAIAR